jgi:hypothetical protein
MAHQKYQVTLGKGDVGKLCVVAVCRLMRTKLPFEDESETPDFAPSSLMRSVYFNHGASAVRRDRIGITIRQ